MFKRSRKKRNGETNEDLRTKAGTSRKFCKGTEMSLKDETM